jgi:pyridoxal 5'-phosphate synthase pdxT subunit
MDLKAVEKGKMSVKIGVLASQGAFMEHINILEKLNVEGIQIRLPVELKGIGGLIIPGGESTTISLLMNYYKLMTEITDLAKEGMPLFGTCAGMIMMAKNINGNGAPSLGLMDITVKRNAFGRQVDSFETGLSIPALGKKEFPAVFIRAPLIESCDKSVEILAKLNNGTIVAARQNKMLATAFHPELTDDLRIHQYFMDMIKSK